MLLEATNARLGEIADRMSIMTSAGTALSKSHPEEPSVPRLSVPQPQSTVTSREPTEETAHIASAIAVSEEVQREITLANGSTLRFTADQVPAPPAVTFVASDIEALKSPQTISLIRSNQKKMSTLNLS